jgi:hypothetical protein
LRCFSDGFGCFGVYDSDCAIKCDIDGRFPRVMPIERYFDLESANRRKKNRIRITNQFKMQFPLIFEALIPIEKSSILKPLPGHHPQTGCDLNL